MNAESKVRDFVHRIADRANIVKRRAILDLLDEEYFSPEEVAENRCAECFGGLDQLA